MQPQTASSPPYDTVPLHPISQTQPLQITLRRAHDQRLRAVYRSAGWPCLDAIEIELLAADLLERMQPASGPEYLRVTDAGMRHLALSLQRNRAVLDRHDALVRQVAEDQVRQGRITYLGLSLYAKPSECWMSPKPDVYSIRNTTAESDLEPIVFEIKVSRADLKGDLKKADKRASYLAVSSACYYVIREGIAKPEEIPPECGVIVATGTQLLVARLAPKKPMTLGFSHWMALAKAERVRCAFEPEPML